MLWFTDSCNPTSKHGVWATFVLASQHSISKLLLLFLFFFASELVRALFSETAHPNLMKLHRIVTHHE